MEDADETDSDERFVIGEWMEVCAALLSNVPLGRLTALHETYDVVRTKRNAANQRRWQRAATWVDRQARLFIPAVYLTLLLFLFCVDLRDDYAPTPTNVSNVELTGEDEPPPMFQGIGFFVVPAARVPLLFVVPVIVLILLGGYAIVVQIAKSQKLLESAQMEKARKQRNQASFTRNTNPDSIRRMSGRVTPPAGAVRVNKHVQNLEAEDIADSPRHSA